MRHLPWGEEAMISPLFAPHVYGRNCGDCQLCCQLLPVKDIDKPANARCKHQCDTGCAIYGKHPLSCRVWTCRWLVDDDTKDMQRPDQVHYVVDLVPDYITVTDEGIEPMKLPVVQVWVDPEYPDAHRDPVLRDYLNKRGEIALVRYSSTEGLVLFPPSASGRDDWFEQRSNNTEREHTHDEVARAILEGPGQ